MESKYYKQIRDYYINGYGIPAKYYTLANLDTFVAKGMITEAESEQIQSAKINAKSGK